MKATSPTVRALLRRIRREGGIAFVAGWRLWEPAVRFAFAEGLVVEVGPDLWALADVEVVP